MKIKDLSEEMKNLLGNVQVVDERECDYCGDITTNESICEVCEAAYRMVQENREWYNRLNEKTN